MISAAVKDEREGGDDDFWADDDFPDDEEILAAMDKIEPSIAPVIKPV